MMNTTTALLEKPLNATQARVPGAVESGEFIAVVGPNGVGQSTLVGTLLGTRQQTGGRVEVNSRVGFIPQQRMFPQELTV